MNWYSIVAPDYREAIAAYVKTLDWDEPMPEFVGAVRMEVAV